MRKAVRVVEVRLPGWMRQRPIRLAAARVFDQRRQTETPQDLTWQTRQAIQLQRGLQCIAVGARPHFDRRRADLSRHTHPASVATEPICRPLCRRRKVEFVILGARRSTDKCLEAGVPPKLVAAHGRHDRRHADVADLAGHAIGQYQTISARTRDPHFNMCNCEATRVRMKSQQLAHTGIL